MPFPIHIIAFLLLSVFTIAMSLVWVKFFPAQKFFSRKVLHVVSIFILSICVEQLNLIYLNQFIGLLLGIELILLFAVNYGFFIRRDVKVGESFISCPLQFCCCFYFQVRFSNLCEFENFGVFGWVFSYYG